MPLTGACAWKERGLAPEERIDRFFNLIDHAVEGGVALKDLYTRKHVKDFLLYTLHQCDAFCKTPSSLCPKDHQMSKLTLTSTYISTVVVGDPGILTVTLGPKASKTVEVTDVQLGQLTPQLEKLKTAGWITFSVDGAPVAAEPVKAAPVPAPEPIAPPPPAPDPENAPSEQSEAPPSEPPPAESDATPAKSAPFFEKKSRR